MSTTLAVDAEAVLEKFDKMIHQGAWKCERKLPRPSAYSHEDLVQEGKEQIVRALPSFRPDKSQLITFVYVCLRNRYQKILDREWRQRGKLPSVPIDPGNRPTSGRQHSMRKGAVAKVGLLKVAPAQGLVDVLIDWDRGVLPDRYRMLTRRTTRRKVMMS